MGTSVKENSTEKLLDVIRGVSHKKPPVNIPPPPQKIEPVNLKKIKKNSLNLGVLLNPEDITFVLSSNKNNKIIKWAVVELPEGLGTEDIGYTLFLESNLENFTEGIKAIPTWCTIDSTKVKLRNITIPDLPSQKIANAAFWGFKKEVDFDADQEIFNFEIIGDRIVKDVKKKSLLAFAIEKTQVKELKTLFLKAGFKLEGITTIPFAFQNFIRTRHLQMQDSPFTIVNVSRKNSDVVCFSDTSILLTRNIRTGSFNLVENFMKSSDKSVVKFLSSLKNIQSTGFSQIKLPSERLIEKISRTSDYGSQNYADNVPMKNFYFIGETDSCDAFMEFAANSVLTGVKHFNPVFTALPGSVTVPYPENAYERGLVTTAFGISLSSNEYTPNFLFTADDKLNKKKKEKINIAASIIFALIFLCCAGFANWQGVVKNREMKKLDEIVHTKNNFDPKINQESIANLIFGTEQKIKLRNQYISDYFPLAVINEICSTTPKNISVSSLEADFSDQNKNNHQDEKTARKILARIIIVGSTGINSDSVFTEYILNLGNSRIFGDVEVLEKNIDAAEKTLKFKVSVEII